MTGKIRSEVALTFEDYQIIYGKHSPTETRSNCSRLRMVRMDRQSHDDMLKITIVKLAIQAAIQLINEDILRGHSGSKH